MSSNSDNAPAPAPPSAGPSVPADTTSTDTARHAAAGATTALNAVDAANEAPPGTEPAGVVVAASEPAPAVATAAALSMTTASSATAVAPIVIRATRPFSILGGAPLDSATTLRGSVAAMRGRSAPASPTCASAAAAPRPPAAQGASATPSVVTTRDAHFTPAEHGLENFPGPDLLPPWLPSAPAQALADPPAHPAPPPARPAAPQTPSQATPQRSPQRLPQPARITRSTTNPPFTRFIPAAQPARPPAPPPAPAVPADTPVPRPEPKTLLPGVPFFDGLTDVDAWIALYQEANLKTRNTYHLEHFLADRAYLWFERILAAKGKLTARSIITLREHFGDQPILDADLTPAERAYNKVKQEGSVYAYAEAFKAAAKDCGKDIEDQQTRMWFYHGLRKEIREQVRVREIHKRNFETLFVEAIRVEMILSKPGESEGLFDDLSELEEQTRSFQDRLARFKSHGWN